MKTLILAGGGHGHIKILKKLIKDPLNDTEVILISDNVRQYYSGMLPGFLEGKYTEDEISFNISDLCKRAGVRFVEDIIVEVNDEDKTVTTENGRYSYDQLSLNLGGISKKYPNDQDGAEGSRITYTKPIYTLIDFIRKNDFKKNGKGRKLAIIGGGASSVETSIALKVAYPDLDISVYSRSEELIRNYNRRSKQEVLNILKKHEIKVNTGYELISVKDETALFIKDRKEIAVPVDFVIISSGITGIKATFKGIKTDCSNFVYTDRYLRTGNNIMAMGDMIRFMDSDLPKAGVFAIHEAPILYENLLKIMNGNEELTEYKPNDRYLQIINTGNRTGLLNWGNITMKGRIPFIIKDWIDRKYMRIE